MNRPEKRSRFQFRLRTFLIAITALMILTGYFGASWYRASIKKQAIGVIRKLSGQIEEDNRKRIVRVYFGGAQFGDDELSEVVPHLRRLSHLSELDLVRTPITDRGIESLVGLDQLSEVYVFETGLTESGMKRLKEILPGVEVKVDEPDPVATKLASTNIYRHAMTGLAWAPNGRMLATGSGDGVIRLWDFGSEEPVSQWQAHDDWAFSVAFSPDGRLLASGGGDNVVRLWDLDTLKLVAELSGHTDDVHCVCFTPDGSVLASAGDDKSIRLWDVHSQSLIRVLRGHEKQIPAIAISVDGRQLASVSRDDTVRLWDVSTGKQIAVFGTHDDEVMAAAFDPSGRLLATAGYDGVIRLWDVKSRDLVTSLIGHEGRVFSIAFDPHGSMVASTGEDGVQLWHLSTGKTYRSWLDQGNVSRAGFHPDGDVLATTNADGELRMLDLVGESTPRIFRTFYGERGLSLPNDATRSGPTNFFIGSGG